MIEVRKLTMSAVATVPFIDTFLCDLLVLGRRRLISTRIVDGCVELSAKCFACAVDHAHALLDRVSESHLVRWY